MQNIQIQSFDTKNKQSRISNAAMQDDRLRGRISSLDPREMLKRMSDLKKLPSGCKVPPVPALMKKGKTVPPGE